MVEWLCTQALNKERNYNKCSRNTAKMGYENPKIGILSAIEKVNPKMPETIDGDKLKQMNIRGEIKDCIIEGPISYDLSMNKESVRIKGYESRVAGDVDVLIVPDIAAGNILSKSLIYSANAKMAGIIVGGPRFL